MTRSSTALLLTIIIYCRLSQKGIHLAICKFNLNLLDDHRNRVDRSVTVVPIIQLGKVLIDKNTKDNSRGVDEAVKLMNANVELSKAGFKINSAVIGLVIL